MKRIYLFACALLLIVAGCKKDDPVISENTDTPITTSPEILLSTYSDAMYLSAPFYYFFDDGASYADHGEFISVINSSEIFMNLVRVNADRYPELYEQYSNIDFSQNSVVVMLKSVPHHVINIESEKLISNDDESWMFKFTLAAFEDQFNRQDNWFLYFAVVPKIDENKVITLEMNWDYECTELTVFHTYNNRGDVQNPAYFYFSINETANEYLTVINSIEQLQEKVIFEEGMPNVFNEVDFTSQSILAVREAITNMTLWEDKNAALIEKSGKKMLYLVHSYYENPMQVELYVDYLVVISKTDDFSAIPPNMYYNNPPITLRSFYDVVE